MSNSKGQNGTSRSDEIYADFLEWKEHVSDDEIREITNEDGCLNKTEIKKALECSRSAVYSDRMQREIAEFEKELREAGILPKESKKSEQSASKASNKKKALIPIKVKSYLNLMAPTKNSSISGRKTLI